MAMLPGEQATRRKTKALHRQPQQSPQPASAQPQVQPSRRHQRCLHTRAGLADARGGTGAQSAHVTTDNSGGPF